MIATEYDCMEQYFAELADCRPPKHEEMKILGWRWINDGDTAARDEMIRRNLRLVVATVKRHLRGNVSFADMVADGNVALIRAVEKWDPAQGMRFSTYATWWIKQAMWKRFHRAASVIHVPPYMKQLLTRWRTAHTRLERELHRAPSDDELRESLGVAPATLRSAAQARAVLRPLGLAIRHGEDDDWRGAEPVAPGDAVEDRAIRGETCAALECAIRDLDPRSHHVLSARFGLDRPRPRTFKEISRDLGLTPESIRQIEQRALGVLRTALASQA